MAENVEGHRGRRGRWLVLAVLLAIAVWVVGSSLARSQRAARPAADSGWPPPRPVDTRTARAPAPQPGAPPRRPSPRPRSAPTP